VFVVAGLAKLADRSGTRQAVVEFGVPSRFAAPFALLLPLAELACAVTLLPAATASIGAAGSLVLVMLFSGAIALSLIRGRAPDCHCFGQLHSAPASWKTLVRNAALGAAAAFALVAGLTGTNASAVAWVGRLRGAELLALVVGVSSALLLAAGGSALLTLLRSYGKVLVRLERVESAIAAAGIEFDYEAEQPMLGLPPGTPAPTFATTDVDGERVSLADLLAPGLPLLLLFTSPTCGPCKVLLPDMAQLQRDEAERLTIAFASGGGRLEEVRAEAKEFELEHVLHDPELELYRDFQANGTPSAVVIAPDGLIGSSLATGPDWIRQLAAQTLAEEDEVETGLPVGAVVPELELSALDGERIRIADFRGTDTLLLFWNPDCGFCRAMHEQVTAWERSKNGSPRLVIVSAGTETEIRSEGFRSTIVVDDDFAIGQAFGAGGTPMAVLIDASGRVAAPLAAGAEQVLALADASVTNTTRR
jgi:thiol-disulfide isomerase/thioredoxin